MYAEAFDAGLPKFSVFLPLTMYRLHSPTVVKLFVVVFDTNCKIWVLTLNIKLLHLLFKACSIVLVDV